MGKTLQKSEILRRQTCFGSIRYSLFIQEVKGLGLFSGELGEGATPLDQAAWRVVFNVGLGLQLFHCRSAGAKQSAEAAGGGKKKHGYSLLKDIIVFIIIIIEVKVAPKKKREVFRNIRSIITDTHNCQMLDFFFSVRAGLSLEALKEHEENMTFQRHKHTQTG